MLLLTSSQKLSPIHPELQPPVPEVVQSPPSKLQSPLFDSSLQTPFATNSVWEQSFKKISSNCMKSSRSSLKNLWSHSVSVSF